MITKYEDWDDETQAYVNISTEFSIDSRGFVVDEYSGRVREQYIIDKIEMDTVKKTAISQVDICQEVETTDIIIDHLNDVFKHHSIKSTSDQVAILELMKYQILSHVKSGWDEFK